MRKRLISPLFTACDTPAQDWLELDQTATVEVTSEAEEYPVEEALLRDGGGWRADGPGTQTIRLLFDQPQTIHHIRLVFREERFPRTQEFIVRWLPNEAEVWKEIVRQQWNFSPPKTTEECEDYSINLSSVRALELKINPDISLGKACASLQRLQIAVRS
jgi:hypothetical protein